MSTPTTNHRHAKRVNDDGPVDVFITRHGDGWIVDVYRAGVVAPIEDRQVPTKELGIQWARARYRHRIERLETL